LAEVAGFPWGSIATLHSDGEAPHWIFCPAIAQTSGWVLPVLDWFLVPDIGLIEYTQETKKMQTQLGLDAALS